MFAYNNGFWALPFETRSSKINLKTSLGILPFKSNRDAVINTSNVHVNKQKMMQKNTKILLVKRNYCTCCLLMKIKDL